MIDAEANILDGKIPNKDVGLQRSSRAVDTSWSHRVGNILNSLQSKTSGFRHGHSAIVTGSNKMVIEATTTKNNGARVFYWHYTNMWYTGNFTDVVEYYVDGASWAAYNNVVRYASGQVAEPYGLNTSLYDDTTWYCSKLVYKAWQYAGVSIGRSGANYTMFLPTDIANGGGKARIYKRIYGGSVDY